MVVFIALGIPNQDTHAQAPIPAEYVSVGDFTGTANERINAAIAAAMGTTHKTVYFPDGTYALRSGLSLNQGTNTELYLIGQSRTGVYLVPDTAYLEANYNGGDWENGGARLAHMMNLDSSSVFESVDVSIQNMTIDMRHQLVMSESERTYNVVGHGVRIGEGWETGQFTVNEVDIRNVGSYGVGIQDRGGHSKNNVTLTNLNIERTGSDAIDTKEAEGDGNQNLVVRNLNVKEIGFLDTGSANALDIRYRTSVIENVNLVSEPSYSTLPGQTSSNDGIKFRPFESGTVGTNGITSATVSNVYTRGFANGIVISSSDGTPHANIAVSDFKIEGQNNSAVRVTGTNHSGHTVSDGYVNPDFGGYLSLNGQASTSNVVRQRWDPSLTPATDTTFESDVSISDVFSPAWQGIVGTENVSLNPTSPQAGPFVFDVASNGVMQIDFDTQFNAMDKLVVDGTLNLGGTLQINAIGNTPVANGTYQIFEAGTITGSFASTSLPTTNTGQVWNTENLATDGTIELRDAPVAPTPPVTVASTGFSATNNNHNSSKPATSGDFFYNSTTQEYTQSFSAGANADMLVVTISVEKSTDPISVTYGGEALTEAVSSGSGSGASLWYLANPSESGDLIIDASEVGTFNGMGVSITVLTSDDPLLDEIVLHTVGSSTGSSSVNITTTLDDAFIIVAGDANSTTGSITLNTPLIEIGTNSDVGSSQAGSGYVNGIAAGSNTFSWNPNASARGMVAASFIAVPEPSSLVLLGLGSLLMLRRR